MKKDNSQKKSSFGPAAEAHISLSQAILAPMDALAKSQVHAARSFLNFLLQIGYPHKPPKSQGAKDGKTPPPADDQKTGSDNPSSDVCYSMDFRLKNPNADTSGNEYLDISIPTLALVPAHPLAIESADYSVELVVTHVEEHRQIQSSEDQALAEEMSGSMDFSENEFTGRLSIKKLCQRLKADKLPDGECENIDDLNRVLEQTGLFGKIKALKDRREGKFTPSPTLGKLVKIYSDTEDSHDLKRLNRIALEECYPDEVPKNQEDRKHPPRPWYLVSEPVSVRGNMAANAQNSPNASIKVNVRVKQTDPPAGLNKLLTSMMQVSSMAEVSAKSNVPGKNEIIDSSESPNRP